MKVIDLLNKIANGEDIPKKFKYCDEIYKMTKVLKDNGEYWYNYINEDTTCLLFDNSELNNEIEIIEDTTKEDKKIPEKLDYCEENTFMEQKETTYLSQEERRLLDSNFKELGNKINSIIDYLKSKGE